MSKTDFGNKLISFNREVASNRTKYLTLLRKLDSLTTKDYNDFLGRMYFTRNDGSQNAFVYQPTLHTLELKEEKGIDYVLSCKSKKVYNSKLKSLYTALLHSLKLFGHRMVIKFDKDLLAVKQNNYLSKILNVYIVYDLDAWRKTSY